MRVLGLSLILQRLFWCEYNSSRNDTMDLKFDDPLLKGFMSVKDV